MIPRPPRSTRTDTPFPYTTRVRSTQRVQTILDFLTARDDVRLLGPRDAQARTATIAFVPVTRTPAEIASELGEHGIMIGSGHFYSVRLCERSEEHTSELQSLMRSSYAVFCLKKKKTSATSDS